VSSRRAPLGAILLAIASILAACSPGSVASPTPVEGSPPPSVAASAQPNPTPTPAAFPVTVTDDEGTAVDITTRPERVVSLTPAATEVLFSLGVADRLVARVEDISLYPPDAEPLPVVATYEGVDIERIVALEADLVVAGGNGFTPPDAVARLRELGIAVLVFYPASIDDALGDIERLGDAVGAGLAARDLTGAMRVEFDGLAALVADQPQPRVFYEIDATATIYTPAADSVYAEMLRLAGADPILTDASYAISLEDLVAADPQVILLGDAAYGVTAEQVAARPGWGGMTAVLEGAIRPIDDVLVTRPGPRLVDGLRALIAAIHPEVTLPG
jgi:iron complex transport system substrate-binding protein